MARLNQILAVERQTKTSAHEQLTKLYQSLSKEALLNGISKTYEPREEDGEKFPSEKQNVQVRAEQVLNRVAELLTPLVDVSARRDYANCSAKGDVEIDGAKLLTGVPATMLLWLEKLAKDMHDVIVSMPELPQTESWKYDANADCFVTDPVQTTKMKKVAKPFVKAPATEQHPAQVDVVHDDVLQGYWTTVKFSGALPLERKRALRERCEKLQKALKFAREQANLVEAPEVSIAKEVFGFLFA